MRKIFCDSCGVEVTDSVNKLNYLAQLDDPETPIPGQSVTKDLCDECYNEILGTAVIKLQELRVVKGLDVASDNASDHANPNAPVAGN